MLLVNLCINSIHYTVERLRSCRCRNAAVAFSGQADAINDNLLAMHPVLIQQQQRVSVLKYLIILRNSQT